jgi:hypothetical protein
VRPRNEVQVLGRLEKQAEGEVHRGGGNGRRGVVRARARRKGRGFL